VEGAVPTTGYFVRLVRVVESGLQSRRATPDDAGLIASILQEGFSTYRSWAPSRWKSPTIGADAVIELAMVLARDDVWCLLAVHDTDAVAHVALAPFTREEPTPPPPDTAYLWQLFVRPAWQGRGVATWLMNAALAEAQHRGFGRLLLWTPRGADQARRFYQREGWSLTGRVHENSGFGLATIEYGRRVAARPG
jgi:GNAT superfamily N-acetyltransferase